MMMTIVMMMGNNEYDGDADEDGDDDNEDDDVGDITHNCGER